ncbi:PEPxxWA-CTERM sorting domain-containing protein [Phenylobacterium sp.]|uniref:PEPxxWA-CTERM sorting domain-containing protein n=1 Tax=Phenylobacterium sp. TaxID=1871053 RepID=UPI0025FF939E|nr:PEPxxWA-CTERM sorting domain-containing protein [Phenylobacterium sp.]
MLNLRKLNLALGAAAMTMTFAVALPSQAGTIYGAASNGGPLNFLLQLHPDGAGAVTSNRGYLTIRQTDDIDVIPVTAMAGVNGVLKGTSLSAGGTFDYYSDLVPAPNGGAGGYSTNSGDIRTQHEGGDVYDDPISAMTPMGGDLYGASWDGDSNYFFQLLENTNSPGAYADNIGGITYGDSERPFGYAIDTLATYDGQMYGTAFDGEYNLFFRINLDPDGAGAQVEGIGYLLANSVPDTFRVTAMVGTDDGIYASYWNEAHQFNYFSKITPGLNGFGGFETEIGDVRIQAGDRLNYKITSLGYLPDAAVGGVPEPATWALMIVGFGLAGAQMRRRAAAVSQ